MCNFQYGTIECRGDGFCWDADNDGFDPSDESMPCPECNTAVWLQQQKEEAETTSFFSNITGNGTGVSIWENAVAVARQHNKDTDSLLKEIGLVKALYEDDAGNPLERIFSYSSLMN